MIKHRFRDLTKSFGIQLDPEKFEELKRTKRDIENNLTRILKLIENEDQSRKDGNPKDSRKETELLGLIEDFYKQYQSFYAMYGRLTGEYRKVVPRSHRVKKGPSRSSSSSDSEYFSSEEVEGYNRRSEGEHHHNESSNIAEQELETGNTEVNDPNQKIFSRKRERSTLPHVHEVLKAQASAETKELENQLTSQMKELESLSRQKGNLELQVESQAHEVKQLRTENTELHARVLKLESLLEEKNGAVSALQAKIKDNKNPSMSKFAELKAQINKLEEEAKSLQTQKGELEEKITSNGNEALSQRKELMDQLNVRQQSLDSLCNQNNELEALLERDGETNLQYLAQIENLKKNLAETTSIEHGVLKEKECFLARIQELELELESRRRKQNDLEEQLRDRSCEIDRLEDEKRTLQDRNHGLEKAVTWREEEISTLLREHESSKNEASTQATALMLEVDSFRTELNTLQQQKRKLELQDEQSREEYSESLAKMEDLNVKLATQVADQEKTIKTQAENIDRISAEYKQAIIKLELNQQFTEKKMEKLAEEFRQKLEDHIRLLHRRIRVAEQLHNENKDSYKMVERRYEQENKMLGEKIKSYEDELKTLKLRATQSLVSASVDVLNGLELAVLNDIDFAAGKLEEHREHVLSLVSKMLGEVQFARDWIKKRNGEMKQLRDSVDGLTSSLKDKEEQLLLLREKVWKLEAKVSKEGGEKLNLTKAVSQLEKKVGKLEKSLKEKDEELVSLGEKKREAIRQLCFLIEFHRERCDNLKDLITKTRISNGTR